METNIDGQSTWSRLVGQWQSAVLVTACVAGGLTLTMMVIGSAPDVDVQASQAAIEAAPVDTLASGAPVVTEVPVDTAGSTDSTEVANPTVAEAAAPAVPRPAPTAKPTTGTPSAPAPAPGVTSGPSVSVTVAAPQATAAPTVAAPTATAAPTTAAPTTAAQPAPQPAPTTAAPTPTTAAPVTAALTYPSFSAGSAATVVLQFDGSSIHVASVARQPNWMSQVDENGPRSVEIKFFNTATQQDEEFHATVENGRIKVEN